MKINTKGLLAVICFFTSISCNKYLDVQPVDRLLDKQVFSSETSIQKALNGIYISVATSNLYGSLLTATTLDVMAQYYNIPSNNHFVSASRYNYLDGASLQSDMSAIWANTYTAILNANQFIQGVSGVSGDVLLQDEKNILLGEAYGLRAFLCFDMLRLYGPIYSTDSASALVPYPVLPQTASSPLLPANNFIDSVTRDLQTAENLLVKDPIIQYGVQPIDNIDITGNFFKARNRRMNYYAVKSLLARVYLYRGDKTNALQNAMDVIGIAAKVFPWSPETVSRAGISNPDRIFSSEIIFGPENTLRDNLYQNYFAAVNAQSANTANINGATLLAPLSDRLSAIYENQENDYRLRSSWAIDRTAQYNFKTFTKYAPLTADYSGAYLVYRNIQPLIRLSELYYIVAESSNDQVQAVSYLNTVRKNRGLVNAVPVTADLTNEITKEYKKEFWGEGQLFFYYKRKNFTAIDDGAASSGSKSMNKSTYVVPLPLGETQYR